MIPVECFFALSALLFFIGVYGFVTRRNLIAMLISVELVLNAVDINFAAINRLLYPNGMEGMFMTLFVIGVAAAESAVAIAIIINVALLLPKVQLLSLLLSMSIADSRATALRLSRI